MEIIHIIDHDACFLILIIIDLSSLSPLFKALRRFFGGKSMIWYKLFGFFLDIASMRMEIKIEATHI